MSLDLSPIKTPDRQTGDWICPRCYEINPPERYVYCFRCRQKKPPCSQLVEAQSRPLRLSSSRVDFMNPPGDGNCLFASCLSKVQNISDIRAVTTEMVMEMRKVLMEYLLLHCHVQMGDGTTLGELALIQANDVVQQLRLPASTCDTVKKYADIMSSNQHAWGDVLEVILIAHRYQLNVTVFSVDPDDSEYLVHSYNIVVCPDNNERSVFLLLHQSHFKRIVSKPSNASSQDGSDNEYDFSLMDSGSHNCQSSTVDAQDIDNASALDFNLYCSLCDDGSNHSVTSSNSLMNVAHVEVPTTETLSDAASDVHYASQERTDESFNSTATIARE